MICAAAAVLLLYKVFAPVSAALVRTADLVLLDVKLVQVKTLPHCAQCAIVAAAPALS
jgi:hypothetical protein